MARTAVVIRPYREADLGAVYDVCVRTADGGADARGKYRSDDLLPPFQGAGHGRALIETFYVAAARAGAAGVHVTVVAANVAAIGFYRRLGFRPLDVAAPGESTVVYLGRRL